MKKYSQLIMTFVAGVGALYLIDTTFGVAILLILTLSVMISFIVLFLFRDAIQVSVRTQCYHLEKREVLQGDVVIQNLLPIPTPWIDIQLYTPRNLVLRGKQGKCILLGPKETMTIPFSYEGMSRGVSIIGVQKATLQHLFGLKEKEIKLVEGMVEKEITIMPEIHDIDPNHSLIRDCATKDEEEVVEGKEVGQIMSTEIGFQCRAYEPGDALNKIHWKQSAKNNKWMVRENLYRSLGKQHLMLDPKAATWLVQKEQVEEESNLIEAFLSMANALYRSGIEVVCYLCTQSGWESYEIQNKEGVLKLQFQLAQYTFLEMTGDIDSRLEVGRSLVGEAIPMVFTLATLEKSSLPMQCIHQTMLKEVHDEK